MDTKTLNKTEILTWFKGVAQKKAADMLDRLQASIDAGYWLPDSKRGSIRAALGKHNVASKIARANDREWRKDYKSDLSRLYYAMEYGCIGSKDWDGLVQGAADSGNQDAARFVATFRPVSEAIARLDATIPPPVFTKLNLSRTVTSTVEDLLGPVEATEVELSMPDIKWVPEVNDKGQVVLVGELIWPEGTVHGASMHHNAGSHCEACGHRIKSGNWVPLVVAKGGKKFSLWTGRDCAKNLFGVQMKGKAVFSNVRNNC